MLAACHIRRITAANALATLQRPALTSRAGTVEAAGSHHSSSRSEPINRRIKEVTRYLDVVVVQIAGPELKPVKQTEQPGAVILRSLIGMETSILAMLLANAQQDIHWRDY